MDLIVSRAMNTLVLAIVDLGASNSIAIPVGVWAAYKRESILDYFRRVIAVLGQSVPVFWLGLMLKLLFATETVFAWPEPGKLMIASVTWRNYPVIKEVVLFLSGLYIFANFFVDLVYAYLNPMIR